MITKSLDVKYLKKCEENSMENMHTDFRLEKVKTEEGRKISKKSPPHSVPINNTTHSNNIVLLENNQEYPREMNSRVLHPFKNSYQLLYNFAQIILCFINKSTSWQFTLVIPYNFLCGDITYKLLLKVRKF